MAQVFAPDNKGSGASPIALAGGVWMLFGTITFSGSYATGGDALDMTKFVPAMGTVRALIAQLAKVPAALEYDLVNKKMKVNWINAAGASEAAGAVEHAAAAYEAIFTAAPVPVIMFLK
jgi:hypothetical protein